jgi:HlyD family secretion protein
MKKRISQIIAFLKANKIKVVIVGIILGVAVITLPSRVTSALQGPEARYETAKVKKEDLTQSVSASGIITAENQVDLKFQTSGLLTWVGVKEGDRVQKWQAIASLDKRSLEMTLKKELNDYLNERWDFEQTHEDYEGIFITNEFRRILEKAQFDLENTVVDVEIANLVIKLATIITPIEGIVTDVEAPIAGVNITPATANFTIADPSAMKFVANVDEADIGSVRLGQKVTLTLDAYPDEEFEGEIGQIAFASITTRGGGTAFPVDIYLPENTEQRFKIGMNGDAEIIVAQEQAAIAIPIEAVSEKQGKKYVEIIEAGKVKEIEVKTGIESDTKVAILEGLSEGQIIITGEKKK